eukprot:30742_1
MPATVLTPKAKENIKQLLVEGLFHKELTHPTITPKGSTWGISQSNAWLRTFKAGGSNTHLETSLKEHKEESIRKKTIPMSVDDEEEEDEEKDIMMPMPFQTEFIISNTVLYINRMMISQEDNVIRLADVIENNVQKFRLNKLEAIIEAQKTAQRKRFKDIDFDEITDIDKEQDLEQEKRIKTLTVNLIRTIQPYVAKENQTYVILGRSNLRDLMETQAHRFKANLIRTLDNQLISFKTKSLGQVDFDRKMEMIVIKEKDKITKISAVNVTLNFCYSMIIVESIPPSRIPIRITLNTERHLFDVNPISINQYNENIYMTRTRHTINLLTPPSQSDVKRLNGLWDFVIEDQN